MKYGAIKEAEHFSPHIEVKSEERKKEGEKRLGWVGLLPCYLLLPNLKSMSEKPIPRKTLKKR